ncbi:hypothetical protein DFH29DRAFT_805779, partial [Suillus ampliporus]
NISGAFIRKLTGGLADAPKNGEEDSCSLIFSIFIVLLLLPTGALCKEIKFSGSEEVGVNHDSLGSAVDANAHHIFVDSMHEIFTCLFCFVDLMSPTGIITLLSSSIHSLISDLGYWDQGQPAINTFMESYKCNKFCKALSLKVQAGTTGPSPQSSNNHKVPLHISFNS